MNVEERQLATVTFFFLFVSSGLLTSAKSVFFRGDAKQTGLSRSRRCLSCAAEESVVSNVRNVPNASEISAWATKTEERWRGFCEFDMV